MLNLTALKRRVGNVFLLLTIFSLDGFATLSEKFYGILGDLKSSSYACVEYSVSRLH
jgi:hypothetical protein